jgi:CelD/BcsL family acetyltransferase involved in cellulose biosynthesis
VLANQAAGASYFQTPDWIVSWWETIGQRPQGSAALVWDEGDLIGLFPLARVREPVTTRIPWRVGITTNAGTGIGTDHAVWLVKDGAEDLIIEWVTSQSGLLLRGLGISLGERIGGRLIEVQRCPRLEIDELSSRMSSKLAKTLRNARRRLADEDVSFIWKPPGEVQKADLEDLFGLHASRRAEVGDASIFEDPMRRAFHEGLLDHADSTGGTATLVAARGDEVVGVLYGFVWQKTFAYYQIGWKPDLHRLSLGSVLVLEAIKAAASHGLEYFDFLRGPETYKYRFGAVDVEEGTFLIGRSLGARLLGAAAWARTLRRSEG